MARFHYSKAFSRYGASMGRSDYGPTPDIPVKVRLQKVPLDSGGYDPGGAYWGNGMTLWRAESASEEFDYTRYFRAPSRKLAKETILQDYPEARFYR